MIQQKKPNSLKGLGGLLETALGRHGIAKQVAATMLIQKANEILTQLLTGPLATDVVAHSFRDGVLTLACRNAPASYDVGPVCVDLARRLEEEFPSMTIRSVEARIKPEVWKEWG